VESGLQVVEENNNKVSDDKVDNAKANIVEIGANINETDIETEHLIASNPVQKSALPPTYEFIINAASSFTNIADNGSSRSKSKIIDADSTDPCTTESPTLSEPGRANLCKKVNEMSFDLEDF
jgi:hypothetical protein